MEYSGHKLPTKAVKILNVCRNDLINNYRCYYCNADAIKVEAYFQAPVKSTYEQKHEKLVNLALAHYNPLSKMFAPSQTLKPLCLIHDIQRNEFVKNRLADYYVFLGNVELN